MDLRPRTLAARGWLIAANASKAAADNAGTVRAIRPIRTMHSSSATSAVVAIASSVGVVRSTRKSSGRASALDMRPSARAAAIATDSCRSSSRSISKATISGVARAQRQASARMAGSSCPTALHLADVGTGRDAFPPARAGSFCDLEVPFVDVRVHVVERCAQPP